ncbi:MAG: ribonuclease PH, partial [Anaerolineales bacterium]
VLCNATVEQGVPHWMNRGGLPGGWLTAEYSLLPRSTDRRVSRETLRPRGRTQEIRRLIGRSLRASVHLERLPPITITMDCDVIQADGGTRTAAITGGYIALMLALGRSIEDGSVDPQALASPVAAVSVGMVEGLPLLDLDYQEDVAADVDANIVANANGEFIEVQSTAEGKPLSRQDLDSLLSLATAGIRQLQKIQREMIQQADISVEERLWAGSDPS